MERWSDSYDRPPGDAIEIQTYIAENVARALRVALGGSGAQALIVGGTQNAEAQNLVLQANEITLGFSPEAFRRGIELLDRAIALDPGYAEAYASKATAVLTVADRYSRTSGELARGRVEALRYAQKAVALAPEFPNGHRALARIFLSKLELRAAGHAFKRAFQLASGDPHTLRSYAWFLANLGFANVALRLCDQAVALDRLNPWSYRNRAAVLLAARRYTEVVKFAGKLKRDSPSLFNFPNHVGHSLIMLGRYDEAQKAYAQVAEGDLSRAAGEAFLAARKGDRVTALKKMDRLEQLHGDAASYQYAEIHAALGNVDSAFAALDRAWQIRDPGLLGMKTDATVDPLRRDPRFAALIRTIGFPG